MDHLSASTPLFGSSFGLPVNATFDYVVVGGGTAGLTLATRLAQNSTYSVAVIEAGTFPEIGSGNLTQIPQQSLMIASAGPATSQVQWGDETVPQKALGGRIIDYVQGRCFGGGSTMNSLFYIRSACGIMQKWADLLNDSSYTFEKLLPFFKKSVTFSPPDYAKRGPSDPIVYNPDAYAPTGGPLHVSYPLYVSRVESGFRKALVELGFPYNPDWNLGVQNGFSEITLTVNPHTATRSSSQTSFLKLALSSTNLQVYPECMAKKILFNGTRATGVQISASRGSNFTLQARKEVVVAAGAFRSPQLLMVSGIGPEEDLKSLGVPIISALEGVGQNLQDNPLLGVGGKVNVETFTQLQTNATFLADSQKQYRSQTGPLTGQGGDLIAFEKIPANLRREFSQQTLSDLSEYSADWPEVSYSAAPFGFLPPSGTENDASIVVGLFTPISRGTVKINSLDTANPPIIDLNLFESRTDQEVGVAAFKRAREMLSATGNLVEETLPGPSVQTNEQILEFIKQGAMTYHHASCTCKMGNSSDPNAVLDSKARVRGVQGLRVVDASAFPILPAGYPQAHVYMLAEKIAADILSH